MSGRNKGSLHKALWYWGMSAGPIVGALSLIALTETQFEWSDPGATWIHAIEAFSGSIWSWIPFELSVRQDITLTIYFFFFIPAVAPGAIRDVRENLNGPVKGLFILFAILFVTAVPLALLLSLADDMVAGLILFLVLILASAMLLFIEEKRLFWSYVLQLTVTGALYSLFFVLFVQGGLLDR